MLVSVTAGLVASASVSAGVVASFVLSAVMAPAATINPGGGLATRLLANPQGTASLTVAALPLNSSVTVIKPGSVLSANLQLLRMMETRLSGTSSLSAALTLMKTSPRTAPHLVPGPGVVIPGPDTPSVYIKIPRRL